MNAGKQSPSSRPQKSRGSAGGARPHAVGGSGAQRNSDSFKPFHSSVNRIPLPRPAVLDEVKEGTLSPELFGDGRAVGHDHLTADRWSGTFDIEMTVRTPLVCGVQQLDGNDGSRTVRVGEPSGKVFISPTMVKGMISRAYEVLTASRFRVFGQHDEALTYRADPAAANGLYGGRVSIDPDTKEIRVRIFKGDGKFRFAYFPDVKPEKFSEKVERDANVQLVSAVKHGNRVHARTIKVKGKRLVTSILVGGTWVPLFGAPDEPDESRRERMTREHEGYICRTTPDDKRVSELFNRKKYERLFFCTADKPCIRVVDEDTHQRYKNVLRSYVDCSEEPGGDRHLLNRAAQEMKTGTFDGLKDGDLVFVVPRGDGVDELSHFDIVPTMVGRRAYRHSPRDLAEHQNVLPLADADQASAADRLFGYVVDSPSENAKGGDVAYRGRISVGAVDTTNVEVKELVSKANLKGHLLPPLLSPKVSSARRFITDKDGFTPMKRGSQGEKDSISLPRSEYFTEGQFLGTAAYPFHRSLLNGDFLPKAKEENKNKKVHSLVTSYVKPESTMRCQIAVENVSSEELGLLLWLLTPENLVPAKEKAANTGIKYGYLRMGLGKPFGLGAIEVRFIPGTLRVTKGSAVADKYAALSGVLGLNDEVEPEDTFLREIPHDFTQRPWVEAFQRAASGYSSGRVRYMTLEENKRNNQTDTDTGDPIADCGISPRDLWGERSNQAIEIPKS